MGAIGSETSNREIRRIDLSDFAQRKTDIANQLWDAAVDVGFFQIVNHGIALADVRNAFAMTERFFALPDAVKARYPLKKALNVGWESRAQVRPSTGTPDQKESYQITRPHMEGLWPADEELAGFKATMLAFEGQCWQVAMQVLSCLAWKLGFDDFFFQRAHDSAEASYQSTLRLLHYFATPPEQQAGLGLWRAGCAHRFRLPHPAVPAARAGWPAGVPGQGDGEPGLGRWSPMSRRSPAISATCCCAGATTSCLPPSTA
jgi:isopenicillin N synthase-like dioxygenase